jgi:hypothetical protein
MHINHSPYLERQFEHLPRSWRDEMWPLETVTTFARDTRELHRRIVHFRNEGLFSVGEQVTRLFKYMGTMTSLINLSVKMGYRNIVLCGVDLTSPGYFYQDEIEYPDMKGFLSSVPGPRHALMADGQAHCGADQVIKALEQLVARPAGAALFVENPSSGLYPSIPSAPDELFKIVG